MTGRVPCVEIFPLEIWECIIRNLRNSTPVLRNCRRVCHDWRNIADKVLQPRGLPWNPEFSRSTGDDEETFREQMQGTRFYRSSSIDEFIQFAGTRSLQLGPNPFPLRSIVIFPMCHEAASLYLKVPLLIAQFGEQVWHCTYYVNECFPQSILALPVIFQMPNLKSLTLLAFSWKRRGIEEELKRLDISPNAPNNLSQVNILGEHSIIPLRTLILPYYGNQLKQLYFFCEDDEEEVKMINKKGYSYKIGTNLPILERLKIFQPNTDLIQSLRDCSKLKELSLRTKHNKDVKIKLENLMGILNTLAEPLSTLHLQIEPETLGVNQAFTQMEKEVIDPSVKFPHLTSLSISYSLFINSPFFEAIISKFDNLEKLLFVDCDVDTELSGRAQVRRNEEEMSQLEFSRMCRPVWLLVPKSVNRISLRRWCRDEEDKATTYYVTCERDIVKNDT
ncbi:Tripartite motif-containing protein 15, partial [Orchesella cincta]